LLDAGAGGEQALLAVVRADQLDARRDRSRVAPAHRDGQRERGDPGRVYRRGERAQFPQEVHLVE